MVVKCQSLGLFLVPFLSVSNHPRFGTFLSAKGEIGNAIKSAIEVGYRHIDCAYVYNNEKEIGDTLQELFQSMF